MCSANPCLLETVQSMLRQTPVVREGRILASPDLHVVLPTRLPRVEPRDRAGGGRKTPGLRGTLYRSLGGLLRWKTPAPVLIGG